MLFHGCDTLGHGRTGSADGVSLVELLQHLLTHVQGLGAELGGDLLGQVQRLFVEVSVLHGAVTDQVGSNLGHPGPQLGDLVVRKFLVKNLRDDPDGLT